MAVTNLDYSIHYSRFHPDSEAHSEMMANFMMKDLAPLMPTDRLGSVLDIGCGYGFAMRALRKLGFENVEGVEVSPQQADRVRRAGLKVEVVEDTAAWLLARPSQFSLILLLDVLEHVPPPEQVPLLRAIFQSVKPGGRVIVQVPNANAILAARWRYIDFTHYTSFTEHSLYFVLRNAGFNEIEISAEKGMHRPSLRIWRKNVLRSFGASWRRYLVRWLWLQVFKAELPWERVEDISFELNLKAIAFRRD